MTVSSTNRKAGPYDGNGVTVAFPFEFKVFAASDVLVVLTDTLGAETELTLTTDYTVALNADQNANPGGTITMLTAPATGYKVTATSQVENKQPTDITNNGGFYPNIIEDALDRAAVQVQQIAERSGRALIFPISSDLEDFNLTDGATAASRALRAIGFDENGNPALLSLLAEAYAGVAPPEFGTYALLRAYAGNVTAAYVRGRENIFDGAFGFWRVDPADTTSADNGGTILVDALGRRWRREFSGAVQVCWFTRGAGTTNDSPAIQAAIDTEIDVDLGRPVVAYRLDDNLIVSTEGQAIYGAGVTETVLYATSTAGAGATPTAGLFTVTASRVRLSGFAVRYPNQATNSAPTAYPPVIYGSGYYAIYEQLDLGNCYMGLWLGGDTEGSASAVTIRKIVGAPIKLGLSLERVLDIPKVSDLHWNYNILGGTVYEYGATLKNWIHANGEAYQIGRCDFGAFHRLFAYGYLRGIYTRATRYTGSADNVRFVDCDMDLCQYPLELRNWSNRITVSRGNYVSNHDSATLTRTEAGKVLVYDVGDANALAIIEGVEAKNFIGDAIQSGSNLRIVGSRVRVFGTDNNASGRNGVQMTAASRHLTVTDTEIDCSSGTTTRGVYDGGQAGGVCQLLGKTRLVGATLESFRWNAGDKIEIAGTAEFTGLQGRTQLSFIQNVPKLYFGTAVPSAGTYKRGDRVVRPEGSASGVVLEWECITGGTPGTWRAVRWIIGRGATASRPTLTANDIGVQYMDTTLSADGRSIFWTGTKWVDAAGATA